MRYRHLRRLSTKPQPVIHKSHNNLHAFHLLRQMRSASTLRRVDEASVDGRPEHHGGSDGSGHLCRTARSAPTRTAHGAAKEYVEREVGRVLGRRFVCRAVHRRGWPSRVVSVGRRRDICGFVRSSARGVQNYAPRSESTHTRYHGEEREGRHTEGTAMGETPLTQD